MFKIGNLEIENNVCLAPMAGVCNSAFRRIVKDYDMLDLIDKIIDSSESGLPIR